MLLEVSSVCSPNEGFTLMSIHTNVDDMKPFLKGISFDVHELFWDGNEKVLLEIPVSQVIMKARASWMSVTRV